MIALTKSEANHFKNHHSGETVKNRVLAEASHYQLALEQQETANEDFTFRVKTTFSGCGSQSSGGVEESKAEAACIKKTEKVT